MALTSKDHENGELQKKHDKDKAELGHTRKKLEEMEKQVKKMESHNTKLDFMLTESDRQKDSIQKDLQNVINERDILGTQLIRRNDELALLYEKIKIL